MRPRSGVVPSEGYEGRTCSRPFSLAYREPSSLFTFLPVIFRLLVPVSVPGFPLFIKIPVILGYSHHNGPYFNLITAINLP